jgi:hypothetical protein|nr:MAG TPA: hypothetical protein [Caudoviricetes sp.]
MLKYTLQYQGKVDMVYSKGANVIDRVTHNTGLADMSQLFVKALTGNLSQTNDIPRLIDIGYVVPGTASKTNARDLGVWMSILNKPVVIGGRQYEFDNSLNNWVSKLVTTIYDSDLNGGILDNVLTLADMKEYQLAMRLCSYNEKDRKYLAEINLSPNDIRNIKESTSVIVTWYSELLFDALESQGTTFDIKKK